MDVEDFDQWNEEVVAVKKHNETLFKGYQLWLDKSTLTDLEKSQFFSGVTFFANTYLTMNEVVGVENGFTQIDSYLGDYFIREVPWAEPETIEITSQGFINFYLYLHKAHNFSLENYDYVKSIINSELDKWIKSYHLYHSSCEF